MWIFLMPWASNMAASSGWSSFVFGMQQLAGDGIHNVIHRIAAADAVAEGVDDLALFHHFAHPDALGGVAVLLADDNVLRDVHQTTGQISRSRRSEGRYRSDPFWRLWRK